MQAIPARAALPRLVLATALFWSSVYLYVPVLGPYAQRLGASLGLVGIVVGSYGFTQLLLRIPLGMLSDRMGRRRPLVLAGFLVSLAAAAGMALSPGPGWLVLFRGLSGATASTWLAYTVLFTGHFRPEQAPRAMGILLAVSQVTQLLSTFGGGLLAEVFGWPAPFLAAAGVAVAGWLVARGIREEGPAHGRAPRLDQLVRVGRDRAVWVPSLISALNHCIPFITLWGFTPVYAQTLGASKTQLGLLSMAGQLPAVVGALAAGTLLARLGARPLLSLACAVMAAATSQLPRAGTVGGVIALQAAVGLGDGVIHPVLMGSILREVPEGRRATALGFYQSIYALGMFGGPALAGALGRPFGYAGIFGTAAAAALLAVVPVLTLLPKAGGAGREGVRGGP